jgi:hypothetical protein
MFRPLGGYLQAIKVNKIKITIASSFCMGRLRSQSLRVKVYKLKHCNINIEY